MLGPLLGAVILVFVAGGLSTLLTSYQLSVSKNYQLAYAVMTGDGPWYRYLVDLLLVNPLILLLAIGALFCLFVANRNPNCFWLYSSARAMSSCAISSME